MRKYLLIVPFLVLPSVLLPQGAIGTTRADSAYQRAIALSNEGRGAAARALVDSVVATLQPASQELAEGLFWKGTLAETEAAAEESYKRIVIEFPLHKRAEESLVRLASLEMMRGNRTAAQRYLDRIIVEHPYGQYRAQASYWRARLFFEVNELDRACAELGTARVRLAPGDAELRTEIDYLAQRCPSVPTPTQLPNRGNARGGGAGGAATGDAGARGAGAGASGARAGGAADSGRGRAAGAGGAGRAANPPTSGRQTTAGGRQTAAADSGVRGRGGRATTAGRSGRAADSVVVRFSVQAAAFPERMNAEAFVDALIQRGYEARIDGDTSPYRVRIGYFNSREEAQVLADELKEKRISTQAYVVEAPRT